MMKKAVLAAVAAAGFTIATPANAAMTITPTPNPCNTTVCSFAVAGNVTTANFSDSASFTLPMLGTTAGTLTNIAVSAATNINFSSIFLTDPNNVNHYFTLSPTGQIETGTILLSTIAGQYTLTVEGTSGGNASYGGNLSFTAVPEPAAWALMILGFGAVGFTMRRRNSAVRSMKASLKFA